MSTKVIIITVLLAVPSIMCDQKKSANKIKAYHQEQKINIYSPGEKPVYFHRDPYGAGTYAFGYQIEDKPSGNVQFREEKRYANGTIEGTYGHLRPDGRFTITHYVADEQGYASNTQSYKPSDGGGSSSSNLWSTTERPSTMPTPKNKLNATTNVTSLWPIDNLNLTSAILTPQIVKDVLEQHNIDLNPMASLTDILNPSIMDIVNGKTPLTMKTDDGKGVIGYQSVENFIPGNFPIVPFELPYKLQEIGDKHSVLKEDEDKERENRRGNSTILK